MNAAIKNPCERKRKPFYGKKDGEKTIVHRDNVLLLADDGN